MPSNEFVPPHVRPRDHGLVPVVQLRPLPVRDLGLHRLVDRVQDVAQRDGGQ